MPGTYEVVTINDRPAEHTADLEATLNKIAGDGGRIVSVTYRAATDATSAEYIIVVEY